MQGSHKAAAFATQFSSHTVEQQSGSTEHTSSQQAPSAQYGVS
jgi:hypothetical protein